MSSEDSGERSEKASDRKIKEARKKGKLSRSQDFTAWLGIGAASIMMATAIDAGAQAGNVMFVNVARIIRNPNTDDALTALDVGASTLPNILVPMLVAVCITTLTAAIAQGGVHLRGVPAKFEQFNVLNGIKRIFSMQSLWEGAKALMKTAAIGLALYVVVSGLVPVLTASGAHTISFVLETAAGGVMSLLLTAIAVGLVLAGFDVMVVRKRNHKHTRSTKKEAKDEHKNTEGDPLIRSQRRARQMAMSRNRMMAAVADASVVLVNPTHYAVALKYEPGKSAPVVVAKGADEIASRIREKAKESNVPIVKDIPLTRKLHAECELGHEIPVEMYDDVALVFAFVTQLKRLGRTRGVHTIPKRRTP